MAISKQQIKHIARLARISFSQKELQKFHKEFESILKFVEKLNEVKTEKVEPTAHVTGLENIMREDKARPVSPAEKERLLELAPEKEKGYVKVKAVL